MAVLGLKKGWVKKLAGVNYDGIFSDISEISLQSSIFLTPTNWASQSPALAVLGLKIQIFHKQTNLFVHIRDCSAPVTVYKPL